MDSQPLPSSRYFRFSTPVVVILSIAIVSLLGMACATSAPGGGSASSRGGSGIQGMYPDSVESVVVLDADAFNADEMPAEVGEKLDIEGLNDLYNDYGIFVDEIKTFSVGWKSVEADEKGKGWKIEIIEMIQGTDFDDIKTSLEENDLVESDYRGFSLWEIGDAEDSDTNRPSNASNKQKIALALFQDEGRIVVADNTEHVQAFLRPLAAEKGALRNDPEHPISRVIAEVGDGWWVGATVDCEGSRQSESRHLRRCAARGSSFSTAEKYAVDFSYVLLYLNENAAEKATPLLDEYLYDEWASIESVEYDVEHKGEFAIISGSVDEEEAWDLQQAIR